jgi:hypothetical protein
MPGKRASDRDCPPKILPDRARFPGSVVDTPAQAIADGVRAL